MGGLLPNEGETKLGTEVALALDMRERLLMAITLPILAWALGMAGQPRQAVRLLGVSERALQSMGAFHQLNDKPEVDGMIAAVRERLDEAVFQTAWAEGRADTGAGGGAGDRQR